MKSIEAVGRVVGSARGRAHVSARAAAHQAVLPRGEVPAANERGTRARVARLILENGPSTAAVLGGRLGLTPAAVRRHLELLQEEGIVEARPERRTGPRGRGRPAKVFAITDAGRGVFDQGYDDLAVSALRWLQASGGDAAVLEFARARVQELERRYQPVLAGVPKSQRVQALADALSADGYAAATGSAPIVGRQLCQHHCPVSHVAAEFPQLCEAETEAFGRLLGAPVQRLATIAHGDGVCTTHVTAPTSSRLRSNATSRGATA